MPRKKSGKHTGPTSPATTWAPASPGTPDIAPSGPSAQHGTEKIMADLRRLMDEQHFSSIEEANQFLEDLLAKSGGRVPSSVPATDLERAQDIVYDAWEASSRKKRIDLAKYALEISPDCADAYVILAEESTKKLRERARLYEQGVQAGERALGKEFFEEEAGHFWGLLETRPYMRACYGLAYTLWDIAERRAAIEHARELLRLNPGDNQGVRYVLLEWLLAEGKHDEAGALLGRYDDDAAAGWLYGRALHGFRTQGRSARVDKLLREALEGNPHVPAYLLNEKAMPAELPAMIEWGGKSEAVAYVDTAYGLWYFTPGALEWLKEVRGVVGATKVQPRRR